MTKAEKMYLGTALENQTPLEVTRRDWLLTPDPELHLTLSDRSTVRVQWCIEHACRLLAVAATPDADFVDCTAEETGLHPDVVEEAVDDVYRAAMQEEAERLADNWDDGRGDEEVAR